MNRPLRHGRRVNAERCDVRVLFQSGEEAEAEADADAAERPGWHRAPPEVPAWIRADGRQARIAETASAPSDPDTQVRRVLPYCAALQGRVMLHAAAVVAGTGVQAFVGPSGAGKSTLTRRLAARGFAPVADDLLLCLEEGGRWVTPLPGSRQPSALPLSAVGFLERRAGVTETRCETLSRRGCFVQLLKHGFGELAVAEVWALQFRVCRRIAERVPGYRLEVPDDRARLPDSIETLIRERLRAPSDLRPG